MLNRQITINSRKFDNSIHKSWSCELLQETNEYWLFVGVFSDEIKHPKLGIIRPNTISYEYYWRKKWFNVFRFHEPEGNLKFYYCNINLPPSFNNDILEYIDLDIDVLLHPNWKTEILDLDEFEANAKLYNYPDYIRSNAQKSLGELLKMIKNKSFPFDGEQVN